MPMRKECISLITVCLTLLLVLDLSSSFFKNRTVHAQLTEDNISVSEQQRLGTDNILDFPEVNIITDNRQTSQLSEQFILLGNNSGPDTNQYNVAISNPDYGLSTPIAVLNTGQSFSINSTTDSDIVYSSADVTLVPITSPFPPANMIVEDVDPESDISLSRPINLGNYTGNFGLHFDIPDTATPGYYMLYVYFKYPTYNLTAVYNTAVQVKSGSQQKEAGLS